jgi:hypothetical protein
VAEYGRIVLEGGKSRKRRKRAKTTPAANLPATPQSAPAMAAQPTPTTVPAGTVPPPPKENSAFASRGPRIAKVEQLSPEEAKEFNTSLKAGSDQKS